MEEVEDALRSHDRSLDFNPERLEEIEDRLAEINGLKRKYGNDVSEILKKRDQFAAELEQLADNEENMKHFASGNHPNPNAKAMFADCVDNVQLWDLSKTEV